MADDNTLSEPPETPQAPKTEEPKPVSATGESPAETPGSTIEPDPAAVTDEPAETPVSQAEAPQAADVSAPSASESLPTTPPDAAEQPAEKAADSSASLNSSAPEPTPASPESSPVPPSPVAPKNHTGWKWLTGVIVIVLLAAAGYGAYHLNHHTARTAAVAKQDIQQFSYALPEVMPAKAYPLSLNTASAIQLDAQLFEGLVRYEGRSKIVPLLATGWTNPDDNDWVFSLRKDVIFHSGRPMTAQDVKYSLDYAVAHQNDQGHALIVSLASTIKSVSVVNDYTVKITTDGPDPTLLNRLASLYIFDSKATVGDPDAGTGPYVVKPGTTLSPQSADLVAAKQYWGGHIYTKAVHMQVVSDQSTLQKETAEGKFDMAGEFSDSALAAIKPKHILNVQDLGVTFIGINTLRPNSPLHSLKGRQAAAYALNIPQILKVSNKRGEQASQLIPPAIPGYDPSIHNTPYNPAKARQLLASVPNASAQITLSYPASETTIVTEIAKELDAAGFNVKPQPIADFNTLIGIGLGGKTDMFYIEYTSDTLDGLDILGSVLTGNNDYSNSEINTLAGQANTTLDPTARIAILQKISRQAAADVPVLPLFTETRGYAIEKPYHLVSDMPISQPGVYFWKVYQD